MSGWLTRWFARLLQRRLAPARVRVELWDGTSPYRNPEPAIGALVVDDARTLRRELFNPQLQFGEAYMAGTLRVRGALEPVLEAIWRLSLTPTWRERVSLHLQRANSLLRSRRNVHHHYDLGNDFYAGWLD